MSRSWADGRLLALDFESDGVDPLAARAVQVACVGITPADPGVATGRAVEVDRWSTLINPGHGYEMNPDAEKVHRISTERIRAEGRPSADVMAQVAEKLYAAWAAGGVVIGHNVGGYDLPLLAAELRRLGLPDLEVRGCVVDTYCLDKCDLLDKADRFRKGSRKLIDAARWWRVTLVEELAHDATEDALASARIAWRMCQRYPELAEMPLDKLHAYQVEQYAKQAASLERHIRKLKTQEQRPQDEIDAVHISREWPVKTLPAREVAA